MLPSQTAWVIIAKHTSGAGKETARCLCIALPDMKPPLASVDPLVVKVDSSGLQRQSQVTGRLDAGLGQALQT